MVSPTPAFSPSPELGRQVFHLAHPLQLPLDILMHPVLLLDGRDGLADTLR